MNYVDYDSQETRTAFQQNLIKGWSSINSNIDKYLEKISYIDVKSRLDKDCSMIANQYSCYVIFLLHKIGTHNLTLVNTLQYLFLNELSRVPFISRVVDKIYATQIIPELRTNILTLNINCSECFLEDREIIFFARIYKTLDLCPPPPSSACTKSIVSAYGMTSKIKILFSTQNIYLGTLFAGE